MGARGRAGLVMWIGDSSGSPAVAGPDTRAGLSQESRMPGRMVRPDEIAGMALFLCGPDGGAISGEAIHLTGGMAWTGPSVIVSKT